MPKSSVPPTARNRGSSTVVSRVRSVIAPAYPAGRPAGLGLLAMLLVALAAYLGVLMLRSASLDRTLQRRVGLVDEVR